MVLITLDLGLAIGDKYGDRYLLSSLSCLLMIFITHHQISES